VGGELKKKMRGGLIPSFKTFFTYIVPFLKEPVEVVVRGKSINLTPPKKIKISETIFRKYECGMCASCCEGYVNIFSEYHCRKYLGVEPNFTVTLNGKEYHFLTEDHTSRKCEHLRSDNRCAIHYYNPLHCMFPPIKFRRIGEVVYLVKQPFSRSLGKVCKIRWLGKEGRIGEWDEYRFHFLRKILVEDFSDICDVGVLDKVVEMLVEGRVGEVKRNEGKDC